MWGCADIPGLLSTHRCRHIRSISMNTLLTPTEFNADSLEAARNIGERVFYSHRLEPVDSRGEIGMQLIAGRLGAATIGYSRYAAEVVVDCIEVDNSYAMCIPVVGGMEIRTSASEVLATPTTAAITGPIRDIHLRGWSEARDPVILLKFERSDLEAELSRMLGRDLSGPVEFAPSLDLDSGAGQRWGQVLSLVASELVSPQNLFWNPLMSERVATTLLSGLLLAADHQYRDSLDARGNPSTPATMRRAVTYIDDHLHEPTTTVSVAAAVGLSVRTLERGVLPGLLHQPATIHRAGSPRHGSRRAQSRVARQFLGNADRGPMGTWASWPICCGLQQ